MTSTDFTIDNGQARALLRNVVVKRLTATGDAFVADLKEEVEDPVSSRPTIEGWPLRKDTGEGQKSIADYITETTDGASLDVGKGMKWYMAAWGLGKLRNRFGSMGYFWFWPVWRRNLQKYLALLGATSTTAAGLGGTMAAPGGIAGEPAKFRSRQAWRSVFKRKKA